MACHLIDEIINEEHDEAIPRKRFQDHLHPFDGYSEVEIYNCYRFPPAVIYLKTDLTMKCIESRNWILVQPCDLCKWNKPPRQMTIVALENITIMGPFDQ
uniref:Uncharacterized protein n=1 Tax=Romanomermis culicivorax TaxID=13658 RepID=A0A915HPC1_ROMCU